VVPCHGVLRSRQHISTLEDETNPSSRNVGNQSPSDADSHLGRMETSTAPLRKPQNSHADAQRCWCVEQSLPCYVRTDTPSSHRRQFMKVLVLSSCPVFRISSGLMKFHVLNNSDVRIPLRPQQHPPPPPNRRCKRRGHPPPPSLPALLLTVL
jgi:hypothetical protein